MKIICDSCGAKYSISDDKVQGKVFKIRCKKCSEVIVVEGEQNTADGSGAQQQQDDYADAYDSGGAAEWYVVIDGERVGPIAADEVEGYFSSGQLHAESYIWKEGFEDWVMLETVSEFSHLVEDAAGPNDQTMVADQSGFPAEGKEAHEGAADAGSGGYESEGAQPEAGDATAVMDSDRFKQNFDEELDTGSRESPETDSEYKQTSGKFAAVESGSYEEESAEAGGGAQQASAGGGATGGQEESDQGGMFAAFDAEENEPQAGGGDAAMGGGGGAGGAGGGSPDLSGDDNDLVGQRNENSVLFSLSNVDDEDQGGASSQPDAGGGAGPAAGAGGASNDKSGLIDIQSLASTHAAMKDGEQQQTGPAPEEEEFVANTMSMPALSPSGSSSSNKGLIIGVSVAAALLSAVIAAGVVMLVVMDDEEEQQVVEERVEQQADEVAEADEDEDAEEADDEPHEAEEAARAAAEEVGEDEEAEADEDEDAEEEQEVAEEDDEDDEEEVAQRDRGSTGSTGSTGGSGGSGTTGSTGGSGTTGSTGGGTTGSSDSGGGGGGGIADRLDGDDDDEPEAQEAEEDLPERLSRSMVQNTIQRYTSRVNDCAENSNPDGLSGNAMIRFQVSGSGSVTSATAQDEFAGTQVGSCIEDVVQQMRFPETEDDNRTINYPFTVR